MSTKSYVKLYFLSGIPYLEFGYIFFIVHVLKWYFRFQNLGPLELSSVVFLKKQEQSSHLDNLKNEGR